MSVFQIVLLVLAVLLVGGYVVFRLLMRGQHEEKGAFRCDGKVVAVTLRFGSKLPKALRAAATSVNFVVCFRDYLRSHGFVVVGRAPASAQLAAHEVGGHVVNRVRKGYLRHWWEIWRDIIKHPFNHDARPSEIQADKDGAAFLVGTLAGVEDIDVLARFR